MKVILFGMFILIFSMAVWAQSTSDEAQKLSAIGTFAIGPVGYAAVMSPGEELARKILTVENAERIFQDMLKNGTPEARLYALWGLRKLQGRASKKIFDEFRTLETEVRRMSGCEGFTEKFSDAVREIEKPFYLVMKTKDLWTMDLERRRAMLTDEEERFLLMIFRKYKSANELDKIADAEFGELFRQEAESVLGN